MKQFRDSIVRRRPMPRGQQADATDAPLRGAQETPLRGGYETPAKGLGPVRPPAQEFNPTEIAPRPAVPGPEDATNRKPQIWDIEAEADGDTAAPAGQTDGLDIRAALDLPGDTPEKTADMPRAAAPAKAEASDGRAKTRILGFHAEDIATDVFAGAPQPHAEAVRFAVGWVVVVEGPGRGASFTLGGGVSTIGRAADQTISLDFGDMSVSRNNHALIAYDEEQNKFFIGHGGKSNIVRRNGAPVLTTEELAHGDQIRIGKTTLRFVALCGADFRWEAEADDADGPGQDD